MSASRRGVIFFLSVATVATVGGLGIRAIRAPEAAAWPGRVALMGLDRDSVQPVRYLAIVDPVRRTVVEVPPEALVEVPGAGFLRVFHAYKLGGSGLVRETLGRLFGVDVPFSASGQGNSFRQVARTVSEAEVTPGRLADLQASLDAAAGWARRKLTGNRLDSTAGPVVVLDRADVGATAGALGGVGTKVLADAAQAGLVDEAIAAASPSGAPSIAPAQIRVDVLNQGPVDGAATKTAAGLRAKGYQIARIGDLKPQDRQTSVVFYVQGAEAKARQVGAELGYSVEPVPKSLTTAAEVVVVLGADAQV